MQKTVNTITLSAAGLRDALSVACVERKSTLPVLECACLRPRANTVQLVSTDLDMQAVTDLSGTAATKEMILFPARRVLDLLKGETGDVSIALQETTETVTVHKPGEYKDGKWIEGPEVEEEHTERALTVEVGGLSYELPTLDPKNFPQVTEAGRPALYLDGAQFREMLAHTMFAISREESRYTINGLLLKANAFDVTLCATDGHRLALEKREAGIKWETAFTETALKMIPTAAAAWLAKQLDKGDVGIAFGEDGISFSLPTARTVFTTRMLTGTFPNYEAVMPRRDQITVTASFPAANTLSQALTKVARMANDRAQAVRWALNGTCELSAESDSGKAKATVPASLTHQADAPAVAIGLNADYMQDVLKVAGKGAVTLSLKDAQTAALVEVDALPGFAYVVMPMRI